MVDFSPSVNDIVCPLGLWYSALMVLMEIAHGVTQVLPTAVNTILYSSVVDSLTYSIELSIRLPHEPIVTFLTGGTAYMSSQNWTNEALAIYSQCCSSSEGVLMCFN